MSAYVSMSSEAGGLGLQMVGCSISFFKSIGLSCKFEKTPSAFSRGFLLVCRFRQFG